jgi:amino acid transporter
MLIAAGAVVAFSPGAAPAPPTAAGGDPQYSLLGLAMVFVLLTYGGWNEAAYLSAELRDPERNIVRTLVLSVAFVVLVYFLVNLAYLSALGLHGLQTTNAAAADAMRRAFGPAGATVLSVFVCGAALSTLNATIFTGARIYYALGRDLPGMRVFGVWSARGENPANAFLLQGAIALALVVMGALTRDGFRTMVEYTSPVFWLFMLLIGNALFVFRRREPRRVLRYRVAFYPVTPLLFIATCGWLLYSSLAYTGIGALVGIAVLIAGLPLVMLGRRAGRAARGTQ